MTEALWEAALDSLQSEMTEAGMNAEDVNAFSIKDGRYYQVLRFGDDPLVAFSSPSDLARASVVMAWAYRRGLAGR